MLAKELVQQNTNKFSTLFSIYEDGVTKRRVERIYSRQEIRKLVQDNLISEYQNDSIIDAVTEYLYGVHVSQ
jgi:Zn-dependent M32 family carboxypeptidase